MALLRTDPLDERAVACGLRSLAAAGRVDAVERVYATYARDLETELGVEPDGAIRALHRALVDGAGDATAEPARAPHRRPGTVPVPWGTTSFVGRRAELAVLDERLASALAGEGGLLAVEGEAGVGKTRLVETFLAGLPDGVRAFAGRCFERDLSAPLEPVRAALGVGGGTAAVAPTPDAARFTATDPRDRGSVHRALTARLTHAAAEGRGAVLFVDDLQWSDAATLEFLAYAAHRIQDERVLIVVSHRREDRTVLERWKGQLSERRAIRTLRLGRFGADHTLDLVAQVLGGDVADLERFATLVHDESEGNAFYVLEYLRWLRDTHQLEPDGAHRSQRPTSNASRRPACRSRSARSSGLGTKGSTKGPGVCSTPRPRSGARSRSTCSSA